MMANKIDWEPVDGGVGITKLVSTDRDIVVPEEIDGMPVVHLGSRFLMGSPNSGSRSLRIPSSVVSFDRDAFSGIMGLRTIRYSGNMDVLNNSRLNAEYDCRIVCEGDGFSFDFISGFPMSFPEFDEAILSSHVTTKVETAMERISNPYGLEDHHRDGYVTILRRKVIPMAEHAIIGNNPSELDRILSTGILDREDLRTLLGKSVLSGKTGMTSLIMGTIRRMECGD